MAVACPHPSDQAQWNLDACNEAGWHCDCGEELGFSPVLDRLRTDEKVACILLFAHEGGLLYVSNGTEGDLVTASVAARCHRENLFDSLSILLFILQDPNMRLAEHSAYWRGRGDGSIPDPRTEQPDGPILAALLAQEVPHAADGKGRLRARG